MQADWEAEFAKYRASPEYQKVNRWRPTSSMNLLAEMLAYLIYGPSPALC